MCSREHLSFPVVLINRCTTGSGGVAGTKKLFLHGGADVMGERTDVSRRSLLKGAGAIAGGLPLILDPTLSVSRAATDANDRLNIACIGVQNRGNSLLQELLDRDDCQVVAICDVDEKLLTEWVEHSESAYAEQNDLGRYEGVTSYVDYREMLAQEDLDGIVVAVPDHNHAHISVRAMKTGVDVYCEKPLSLTVEEGRIITDAVEARDRILQVGSQRRSSDQFRHVCELVRNGRIGELQHIDVRITTRSGSAEAWSARPVPDHFHDDLWLGPAFTTPYHPKRRHYDFRFVTDYSGGDITNMGAHFVDLAQWANGTSETGPVEVHGRGKRNETGLHDVFYDPRVEFTYENGVTMTMRMTEKWGDFIRFEGTEGWISAGSEMKADPASVLESEIGPDETSLYRTDESHIGNFLQCVRERRQPSAPAEVGHRSATICHLANIAMLTRRRLEWDPEQEKFPLEGEANRLLRRAPREPWTV